jgi:hypothetical protein
MALATFPLSPHYAIILENHPRMHREMGMIFWLVLTLYNSGAATALHVGNFPTMDACRAAGRSATGGVINGTGAHIPEAYFLCVQANVVSTNPPL